MRSRASLLLAILALLVGASSAGAATKVVSFDDQPAGTTIGNQYAGEGVTFVKEDSLLPVIRSAPGEAHSGTQVADFTTCPNAARASPSRRREES